MQQQPRIIDAIQQVRRVLGFDATLTGPPDDLRATVHAIQQAQKGQHGIGIQCRSIE